MNHIRQFFCCQLCYYERAIFAKTRTARIRHFEGDFVTLMGPPMGGGKSVTKYLAIYQKAYQKITEKNRTQLFGYTPNMFGHG